MTEFEQTKQALGRSVKPLLIRLRNANQAAGPLMGGPLLGHGGESLQAVIVVGEKPAQLLARRVRDLGWRRVHDVADRGHQPGQFVGVQRHPQHRRPDPIQLHGSGP